MPKLINDFNSEIRITHRYFLLLLAYLGIMFSFMADSMPVPSQWRSFQIIGVLIYAAIGIVWLIDRHIPRVGQVMTIILSGCIVYAGYMWTENAALLTLISIPIGLAAALINLRAAAATAGIFTLIILLLLKGGLETGEGIIPLAAAWGMVGIMCAVYLPIYRASEWFWSYYRMTASMLEESRDQKAELKQTLNDLERANLNLTHLNRLAQGLHRTAEEARAAKAEFVANVSHELRTPLNMITGFAELLLQSPQTYGTRLSNALLSDLSVIYRNAEHLSKLIDDVLDLSQVEADQMALTKEYVRIKELIDTSVQAVRPLYESKGLLLQTDVQEDLPEVFCDQTRIREVLLNLLSNAGRFMEQGGAYVRAWQDANMLVVSVTDTGPGIAKEDLNKLFKPFQQIDGSIRRRHGGTGLGLSISKHFIELHGGKIWVASEQGAGTTFFFQIPVVPSLLPIKSDSWRAAIPDWEYVGRTQPSLAPKQHIRPRIAILDSENILQRLLSRYWSEVEIIAIHSPEEAVQRLSRVPVSALIVNDISMYDGAFSLPSSLSLAYAIPVFICSVPGVTQMSADLGIADRLVKPISRADLLDSLAYLGIETGTLLIVDDEPDVLQLLSRMLISSERNYQVLMARNGLEAIDILQEQHPDAILLDLVMPNMDGFELLEKRKLEPVWQEIPVILISSRDARDQPIVSKDLTVTLPGGLSVSQLLASIRSLSKILAPTTQVDDRA